MPKFTVILGGSFGAGNYGMCGRAYRSVRWLPVYHADSPQSAVPVDVAERAHFRHGRSAGRVGARHHQPGQRQCAQSRCVHVLDTCVQWSAEKMAKFKAPIIEGYEREGHPYYASARSVSANRALS